LEVYTKSCAGTSTAERCTTRESKKKETVEWIPEREKTFTNSKESLAHATMLVHPETTAKLRLITDAFDTAIGAVLQQRDKENWQPLVFLSKKLSDAQRKYKQPIQPRVTGHIHGSKTLPSHAVRTFSSPSRIKPPIYAFRQDPLRSLPRQARHLELIG